MTDKNPALAAAIAELKSDGRCATSVQHRRVKYLNNRIEGDHGRLKRIISPKRGFKTPTTAYRTLKRIETMHALRKGQGRIFAYGHPNPDVVIVEKAFAYARLQSTAHGSDQATGSGLHRTITHPCNSTPPVTARSWRTRCGVSHRRLGGFAVTDPASPRREPPLAPVWVGGRRRWGVAAICRYEVPPACCSRMRVVPRLPSARPVTTPSAAGQPVQFRPKFGRIEGL